GVPREVGLAQVLEALEAEEREVVAERRGELGLAEGLVPVAEYARDLEERPAGHGGVGGLGGEAQHGLEETGLPDLELRRVHAHGHAAGPGRDVVAGKSSLPALVEAA